MKLIVLFTIGFLSLLCVPTVSACGHCVEDKMAAVYDFAVMKKAEALNQHVAFVAIDGTISIDEKTRSAITDIVRMAEGVDRASVRVSLELASLSFAYDPKQTSFASIHRSIGRNLSRTGLRISEIKILSGGAPLRRRAER